MSAAEKALIRLPLDESLYSLNPEEKTFFKSQTGIDDDDALRDHILAVQKKAYAVHPYPGIRRFSFTKFRITLWPAYGRALQLCKERKDAIFVEVGCSLGQDLRKIVVDGWPVENAIGFDLHKGYWKCGHELFKTTQASFPAPFICGDVFDSSIIAPRGPFNEEPPTPRPDLHSLTSLTPLQGFVSVIHATSFFHLFNEEQQLRAARQLATLLSPAPGSLIFGSHLGFPVKGSRSCMVSTKEMFCHSPETWQELWDGQVFVKGSVQVDVELREIKKLETEVDLLVWSVRRL
jgi:hypothetical protein